LALAVLLAATASACVTHRNRSEERGLTRTRNDVVDAAATPLRDVGLIRPGIPDALENLRYPYLTDTVANNCESISYEIAQLDAVLGPESYQPGRETTLTQRGFAFAGDYAEDYAVDAVQGAGDIVPFRSWVRRLSGAARAEKKAARAIELGHTRRTFLRGYGAALGCTGVVPAPPPPRRERNRRRNRDGEQEQAAATPASAVAAASAANTTPTESTTPSAAAGRPIAPVASDTLQGLTPADSAAPPAQAAPAIAMPVAAPAPVSTETPH
jgi:hypothetical protein